MNFSNAPKDRFFTPIILGVTQSEENSSSSNTSWNSELWEASTTTLAQGSGHPPPLLTHRRFWNHFTHNGLMDDGFGSCHVIGTTLKFKGES